MFTYCVHNVRVNCWSTLAAVAVTAPYGGSISRNRQFSSFVQQTSVTIVDSSRRATASIVTTANAQVPDTNFAYSSIITIKIKLIKLKFPTLHNPTKFYTRRSDSALIKIPALIR